MSFQANRHHLCGKMFGQRIDILPDGALVTDGAGDTLRNLEVLGVAVVARLAALGHCLQAAHAPVLLHAHSIHHEVLACITHFSGTDFQDCSGF